MPNQWEFIEQALAGRREEDRYRALHPLRPGPDAVTVERDGKRLLNFCSNDYLALSKHPALTERAAKYGKRFGAGSTASRLISGTYTIHEELERKLASALGSEAALVFNSGFQANSTIIGTLAGRNSLVLTDKLSHNSLLQGALLSRADFRRFAHNDLVHLESLLEKAESEQYDRIIIVTETVFSMDGDRCDLEGVVKLAGRYGALLFVDDAHAVGVWGPGGLGLAVEHDGIDITLGTFGKAFGVFGAFVACTRQMREYLVNFCPGFIYTTALPPPTIGAIDAALELIPAMEEERAAYHGKIDRLKSELNRMGFDTGESTSQIIPLIIGSEQNTIGLSRYLEEHGILAAAIRPPTVPEASSRIRLTLTAGHTAEHLEQLMSTLEQWNA